MKNIIVAIKDTKIGFMPPFTIENKEVAKRTFAKAIQKHGSNLNEFPADMELWEIGSYENNTGKIETSDQLPKLIITGIEAKEFNV